MAVHTARLDQQLLPFSEPPLLASIDLRCAVACPYRGRGDVVHPFLLAGLSLPLLAFVEARDAAARPQS